MPQGDAIHTPLGPHDYLVMGPFIAFEINTGAPGQFASGEQVKKTGENATDVRFQRVGKLTQYYVEHQVFRTRTVQPKRESVLGQ